MNRVAHDRHRHGAVFRVARCYGDRSGRQCGQVYRRGRAGRDHADSATGDRTKTERRGDHSKKTCNDRNRRGSRWMQPIGDDRSHPRGGRRPQQPVVLRCAGQIITKDLRSSNLRGPMPGTWRS